GQGSRAVCDKSIEKAFQVSVELVDRVKHFLKQSTRLCPVGCLPFRSIDSQLRKGRYSDFTLYRGTDHEWTDGQTQFTQSDRGPFAGHGVVNRTAEPHSSSDGLALDSSHRHLTTSSEGIDNPGKSHKKLFSTRFLPDGCQVIKTGSRAKNPIPGAFDQYDADVFILAEIQNGTFQIYQQTSREGIMWLVVNSDHADIILHDVPMNFSGHIDRLLVNGFPVGKHRSKIHYYH